MYKFHEFCWVLELSKCRLENAKLTTVYCNMWCLPENKGDPKYKDEYLKQLCGPREVIILFRPRFSAVKGI